MRGLHGRGVKGKQAVLPQFQVIERGNLHEEIMRMLAVNNRLPESSFALLKQKRVVPARDGCGLKA